MTTAAILEHLQENYPDCLLADGFEDAILGVVEGACREPVVCYDFEKCVLILMEKSSMDEAEAEEFLNFNTIGAYVGAYTPLFLHIWREGRTLALFETREESTDLLDADRRDSGPVRGVK